MERLLVHIVYIHGFQGDHTSFQSFPLHLQETLTSRIPPGSRLQFQSSLYPTYKSTKPISYATARFLEWLSTQPEGPVILVAHSMGGLLAAEAATVPSNKSEPNSSHKRIIGVVACDVPYLGLHPHVVITGIASLLPKGDEKTEQELNQHPQIQIVMPQTEDEWEQMKKTVDRKLNRLSAQLEPPSRDSSPSSRSPSPSRSSPSSSLFTKAVDFLESRSGEDDAVVRWLRKHADDPLSASKRWVVERFQFGSCMFDPSGLKDRYVRLVQWDGHWVNYWSHSPPKRKGASPSGDSNRTMDPSQPNRDVMANDLSLLDNGIYDAMDSAHLQSGSTNPDPAHRQKHNKLRKARKATLDQNKHEPTLRHFLVLPTGLGSHLGGWDHWEKVEIAGVKDEVGAHLGLFIPDHNKEYQRFVDRVADKVLEWCSDL